MHINAQPLGAVRRPFFNAVARRRALGLRAASPARYIETLPARMTRLALLQRGSARRPGYLFTRGVSLGDVGDNGDSTPPAGSTPSSAGSSWADMFSTLAKTALPLYQNIRVFNTQVARANAGQPLLPVDQLAPPLRVEVAPGLPSGLNWTKILLIGGLGLGAVLVLPKLLR